MTSPDDHRRKLLKTVLIGGGVLGTAHITLEKWAKPVIDSVILPAHATTSNTTVRYSFVDPNYIVHGAAQKAFSAQSGTTSETQNSDLIAKLSEILLPSVHAAVAPQSTTARLELYLERLPENTYKFVLLMTLVEQGLSLVLFGDGILKLGDNTCHLSLCKGRPNPFSVVLERVTPESAIISLAGETFEMPASPQAVEPVKQDCSET